MQNENRQERVTTADLVQKMLRGNHGALARLISLVESDDAKSTDIMPQIYPHVKGASVRL